MRRPALVLTALLGLAHGQIQENKLRFEAVEPLVAASSDDLTISLFVSDQKSSYCKLKDSSHLDQ